jgi:hypothetical protein
MDVITLDALRPEAIEASDTKFLPAYKKLVEEKIDRARTEKARAARLDWRLREDLGPIAIDGDAHTARVVHLKANPRYGDDGTRETHYQPSADWPLSVAGPHIAPPTRAYYQGKVFRHLQEAGVSLEQISTRMLKVEVCPWASKNWPTGQKKLLDALSQLPSRAPAYRLVEDLVAKGAVVIIARAANAWFEGVPSLVPLLGKRVFATRSDVAPWISRGAFPQGWGALLEALKS